MPEDGNGGAPTYGYLDQGGRSLRLRLGSPEAVDRALADHSPSYRSLDTAVLEKLVLEDTLGLTEDDISHQRGLAYARDLDQATRAARRQVTTSVAFLLRPTPIEQVEAVAAGGRDDAAEVDLLLPEAALRAAVQPALAPTEAASVRPMTSRAAPPALRR